MTTRERARHLAVDVLQESGHQILRVLREHEDATEGNSAAGPANLIALMEIYAARLDTVREGEAVEIIDGRMGSGWTRRLADALKGGV